MSAAQARVLRLEPELTIYSAAQVRQTLLDALVARDALTLDLADVCEVDSAGVQLLLAAMRHAGSQGVALQLAGHSDAVREAFALLGLDAQLAPRFINAN
ncbi:STAS domain-containing protein [Massilia violaceinigra]|uniref:STAS domain-containing protein n=1 Tax=Massilia violaceinigra TaxID=2045208 RepID=A0ABY4A582_9BURK|nr:STAS domain-containing protein [Massilia violaceinigra]UOD29833.1 STAS domain-containing protein [Massilia violaceinigra]